MEIWRVPSDDDFKELEMHLGMSQADADDTGYRGDIGPKLAGGDFWSSGKLKDATSFGGSGFNAIPGGRRIPGLEYDQGLDQICTLWSSTARPEDSYLWYRMIIYNSVAVIRYANIARGHSIRLVRDDTSLDADGTVYTDNYTGNDGTKYDGIKFGDQVWTLQNLKETKYVNGHTIPRITDWTAWFADTAGARCEFNNLVSNGNTRGFLYSSYVINNVKGLVRTPPPIFSNYTIANRDKNITVKDKYTNELVVSSTSTLLGGDNAVIKGYSEVRAVITAANKMVTYAPATPTKYRLFTPTQNREGNYSSSATVNIDLDNVSVIDFDVAAIDSHNQQTVVRKSISYLCNYTPVNIISIKLERDNNVDSETKLIISGTFMNAYFGGGTTGVANTITLHWRYKESTASWGSQTWTQITPDISSNSFAFQNYVNGDLGVDGFNTSKAYDIEVRVYDKLSQQISTGVLNKGIPLVHFHKDGVAIKSLYDEAVGGGLQVGGKIVPPVTISETAPENPVEGDIWINIS